jgi:glutamate N-acetyltransferase/amino-acid N-acetyltransferase
VTEIDFSGSSTSPKGFRAGATFAGIKTYGEGKLDVGILVSDSPCTIAGTFTKARLHSASVDINRVKIGDGRGQAVVVNSGCANSSTGKKGEADGRLVTEWVGAKFGIPADDVYICSTGVIGHFLPMDKMENAVAAIGLEAGAKAGDDFAKSILTTDTRPKQGSVKVGPYTLGGCCKGSGMIHPNMATMLAFLTTDAPVAQPFLQKALSRAVDKSFNLVSIDGDTSPSDTVLLFANGAGGGETIDENSALAGPFQEALEALSIHLAKEIARDGEGATRVMEIAVTGAKDEAQAAHVARLLTTSYLLKSAINGADPNWGRIITVIGRSDAEYDEDDVTVAVCGYPVFAQRGPTKEALEQGLDISEAMKADTVRIDVSLGAGPGAATGWGCDLTAEYVHINADYHT